MTPWTALGHARVSMTSPMTIEATGPALHVGVLGPLVLYVDGTLVEVPGERRRALLAVLALEAGRTVGIDRLVDSLWPDGTAGPPDNAQQALYNHVSRLRAHLGRHGDRLRRDGAGYRLVLDPDELDVARVRRLARTVTEAAPAEGARLAREALDLWRGPALEEFRGIADLAADAVGLDELRLRLVDDLLAARLEARRSGRSPATRSPRPRRRPFASGRRCSSCAPWQGTGGPPRRWRQPRPSVAGSPRRPGSTRAPRSPISSSGWQPATWRPANRSPPPGRRRARWPGRTHHWSVATTTARRCSASCAPTRSSPSPAPAGSARPASPSTSRPTRRRTPRALTAASPGSTPSWSTWPRSTAPSGSGQAVASTLGLRIRGELTPDDIADALAGRELLLVLDNCEHVAVACRDLVVAVRRRAATVRVLATSRVTLHVPGEYVVRLQPLPVPRDTVDLDALRRQPAVQAFLEHARRRRADFDLDVADAADLVEVLRRLDGLPLGIELAARQVSVMPVRAVRERLDRALDLVTGAPGREDDRQRSLRATIASSYRLLGEPERRLLRALAPFPGGVDLAGVEHLAAIAAPESDSLDLLHPLVDSSLLVTDAAAGRYRLLFTVRAFLLDELVAEGERDVAEERFLERCVRPGRRDRRRDDGPRRAGGRPAAARRARQPARRPRRRRGARAPGRARRAHA